MKKRNILLAAFIGSILLFGCSNSEINDTTAVSDSNTVAVQTILETDELESNTIEIIDTETSDTNLDVGQETDQLREDIVIVLDAGHDSEFCRRDQTALGVSEQDLNLTIALACRERLEQYDGIQVYMTREDGSCPDAEHGGEYCIEARTGYATEVNADLFVSLHNNATTGEYGASANGAEVYVSNYSAYTEEGKKLGQLVLDHLSQLDLAQRGVLLRTKPEKGYYDDGSVQDWYYLISYNVEAHRPAMIIEHAYMDNPHDNAILKDDENLRAMGVADADAIAEYYQLPLKDEKNSETQTYR